MTMISGNNRPDPEHGADTGYSYYAEEQDAKMEPLSDLGQPLPPMGEEVQPETMTVKDAIGFLSELPEDGLLLICAHEFAEMEGRAWTVSHFAAATNDDGQTFVLIEGAADPSKTDAERGMSTSTEVEPSEAESLLGRGEV